MLNTKALGPLIIFSCDMMWFRSSPLSQHVSFHLVRMCLICWAGAFAMSRHTLSHATMMTGLELSYQV